MLILLLTHTSLWYEQENNLSAFIKSLRFGRGCLLQQLPPWLIHNFVTSLLFFFFLQHVFNYSSPIFITSTLIQMSTISCLDNGPLFSFLSLSSLFSKWWSSVASVVLINKAATLSWPIPHTSLTLFFSLFTALQPLRLFLTTSW